MFGLNRPRRRPTTDPTAPVVRGRLIRPSVAHVVVPVQAAEPIGTAMMASLGLASATGSPMSDGGARASFATGAGIVGRDARRTGALQDWRGLHGPVATPASSALGAQSGPSQQPAFPSTGTTAAPSIHNALAGMGLPQVLTVPDVR